MKIINENKIEEMMKLEKYCFTENIDINDAKLIKYLSYYDFICKYMDKPTLKEDIKSIVYSKYYWFIRLKQRYFEVVSYDAGIEQEEFKILEEIEYILKDDVDWSIVQEIDESLNYSTDMQSK